MYNKLEHSMNFWNILTVNIMDISHYTHIVYNALIKNLLYYNNNASMDYFVKIKR